MYNSCHYFELCSLHSSVTSNGYGSSSASYYVLTSGFAGNRRSRADGKFQCEVVPSWTAWRSSLRGPAAPPSRVPPRALGTSVREWAGDPSCRCEEPILALRFTAVERGMCFGARAVRTHELAAADGGLTTTWRTLVRTKAEQEATGFQSHRGAPYIGPGLKGCSGPKFPSRLLELPVYWLAARFSVLRVWVGFLRLSTTSFRKRLLSEFQRSVVVGGGAGVGARPACRSGPWAAFQPLMPTRSLSVWHAACVHPHQRWAGPWPGRPVTDF